MPDRPAPPDSSNPRHSVQALTDRVLARVEHESLIVDRLPRLRRRSSSMNLEARSLRRVFSDLGDSYRDYRRRTGQPVSAEIRAAAERFRKDATSTTSFRISSLDRLEILPW